MCHTDMEPTGTFHCSHDGLNRLHENVRWSMRGNFVDLPTDCPQRDERLGWTGDIQVFAPTASFLYDCRGFLASWLQDLAAEQERARHRARVRPVGRPAVPGAAGGGVGRRCGRRAVGAVRALRRHRPAAAAVRQHARVGRPDRRDSPATTTSGTPGSSSATGSTPPPRPTIPAPPGPTRRSSPPPTTPTRHACWRGPPTCSDATRTARATSNSPTASSRPSTASSSPPPVVWRATPRPRTRWRCGSTCSRPKRSATGPRQPARRARAPGGLLHRHRLRRHAARLRRTGRRRLRRRGLPPAAAGPLPVLAVPGLDGRDDGVGALGQHAARRVDQPRRDDLVQPLRARRRRRLPAPRRRRPRSRRTRLPHAARSALARAAGSPRRRRRCAPRTATPACVGIGLATGSSSTSSFPSGARPGSSCPAATSSRSGRARTSSSARIARRSSTRPSHPVDHRSATSRPTAHEPTTGP